MTFEFQMESKLMEILSNLTSEKVKHGCIQEDLKAATTIVLVFQTLLFLIHDPVELDPVVYQYEERLKGHGEKEEEKGQLLMASEQKYGESNGRGRGRGKNHERGQVLEFGSLFWFFFWFPLAISVHVSCFMFPTLGHVSVLQSVFIYH
ncbi:hypothetical protein E3N88_16561 [Mikania micrantha]|uniref:Uncharacterized protein n=1 Tax=Mikania micrantha TaxID=192012 RepID=A0A5N6P0F6_9ASTR|nr:hypothetical protein E3N88_16561 [Mikania micrantha]